MPSENYSFLDVAVLEAVRQRFAAGDAIALLSADLEQVIWANGPGAAVFGYPDIEATIGASTGLPLIARRQIMATSGFPQIGRDRAITVRLATGLTSRAVGFLASAVTMPDGEKAIMLAVPAAQTGSRSAEIAAQAISGFTEDGHFIAFVDAKGNIEAASDGFSALGILPETLAALVTDVANENDRIVKRLVPGGTTSYPAGLARLTDERHLLVVIDENRLDSEAGSAGERSAGGEIGAAAADAAVPPKAEQDKPPATVAKLDAAAQTVPSAGEDTSVSAEHDVSVSTGPDSTRPDSTERGPEAAGGMPPQHDHWYFSASEDEGQKPGPDTSGHVEADASAESSAQDAIGAASPTERAVPSIDRAAPPLRFVWRTDAEGRFSALSPEFAELVGKPAADVIGRRFRDVAATFDLDASGEIADLLDRRDTWSGRSVLWPVAGTDFKIPVDLAALPVYGRSRAFEGFRGFGVARTGDAVVDPEAIGMALVPNAEAPAAVEPEVAETPDETDPFQGEVPALTIVPKPERRFADKVIRLAEHRQPANDKGLSTLERSAFREIGERLKKDNPPTEQPDAAMSAEPAAAEPSETDVEDEKDVARLDGEQPEATVSGISGSLLDYADRDYVADNSDGAPVSEPDKAAQELVEPTDTGSRSTAAEDDDSMTAADFRDAEDSEDWAPSDDDETRSSTDPIGDVGDVEPAPIERPRLQVPPLKLEGFVPSAFSTADGSKAPDTSILGKLPVPLLIHSGDDLHYANEEFLSLTGYDTLDDLEDAGGLGALFADPYDDSASDGTDHALRLKTHDGQEFPIEAILRSVPWRGGKALMLVVRRSGDDEAAAILHGTADDQTQPDTSELKARIAEMRTIIDTATDGVVLISRDGTIRSISRPAEALFGFDSDEVTGKPFVSLFAIESQRAARDYLDGLSEPGVASVLNDGREVIGREAQGRFIPLFMTIGSLPNDSGFCAVVRDITQWKRAEEDLTQARAVAERASSQKTDFLARISHEIRTPLNAIIGFSELMVDEKFGPVANDRYRDYLRDINRSGNHVLDLVNDLLDISKIEAGQQEMAYEAVSLNDTLSETVAMMQPQANRERVIIRSSFASRLPEVVADLRSVRQIALNILSNAIRYTQAGGQVIVSTAYEISGDVVMRVRDTGIGMSQSEIEQALKPFKQINALKRGRGDGTGLGLPLTKAMVEANRARFTINSTPGEGTLVEVAFPSTRVLAD
ncbi:MAG: PAS domain S-box protein [Mesorhizobium sp.]|uniref:PAS domain S-box protein n=1 Tax=Mesorhizobium sp. TaxID=1871066 RepID=UPI000FE34898|nr:PAS domain S-box protein [Mesorhizobium sp.]RWF86498.1 MAG: PAS domain S-box protein [Mesorhizobium sp.]RWF93776.1 MAG: PAS domain S-box protein [Mesorhizobium sp.]RWI35333.1 MAG: PAS domain S-box protein [Mesorhizobium sp.]RWI65193.1 MAG: PAS domain S-box protein [Mesorhizobium sp.]RWI82022.1 MAG: PAS domain S-box protein [Mesorhizobium sp.]